MRGDVVTGVSRVMNQVSDVITNISRVINSKNKVSNTPSSNLQITKSSNQSSSHLRHIIHHHFTPQVTVVFNERLVYRMILVNFLSGCVIKKH